ncbi:MAG: glycosyltransferase family 1 protein [Verrucomicrobia bacterium]|nr:glycosyltransferase family 1 protein [Verrucomicrobiota bacterium]
MARSWFARLLPGAIQFHLDLAEHCAGRLTGSFTQMPEEKPSALDCRPLRIHFWTPHPWYSAVIHVDRVVPQLREQAAALGLPWQITFGDRLPETPVDWLLCLKGVPPAGVCPVERTVLLLPDDADRVWGRLQRFGHVVSVTSEALASLLGAVHPHAWFMDETESPEWIEGGRRTLERAAPSNRQPLLLWHGTRESMLGLQPLRPVLETFARETAVELVVLTGKEEKAERWGDLRVRHTAWSPENLAALASQARLSIAPARPTLADSYLKNAGRLRRLFGAGCPAIGDARVADVVKFSEGCGMPVAQTPDEWLAALRQLWREPARLDEIARRGHALVSERYSTVHTAAQWLWFFCTQGGR